MEEPYTPLWFPKSHSSHNSFIPMSSTHTLTFITTVPSLHFNFSSPLQFLSKYFRKLKLLPRLKMEAHLFSCLLPFFIYLAPPSLSLSSHLFFFFALLISASGSGEGKLQRVLYLITPLVWQSLISATGKVHLRSRL